MNKIKILFSFILILLITGCTDNAEYIPTALVSNVIYNEVQEELEFQVDVTDKSNTLKDVEIELYNNDISYKQRYNDNNHLYIFNNIEADSSFSIKIKATYEMNSTLLENKDIFNLDITNYLSTTETYFPSQTFIYTSESYSIYLINLDEKYTVKYKNNNQSEIGSYLVTADVYLDDELIKSYTAYLVITNTSPEIFATDQTHYYTGEEIKVVYKSTNNFIPEITYNNQAKVPTDVGLYNVLIKIPKSNNFEEVSIEIEMEIVKTHIEINSKNTYSIYDGKSKEIDVVTNIECEYEVYYFIDNQYTLNKPTQIGDYSVKIVVEDTLNYYGTTKYLMLSIISEDVVVKANEIFVSQVVHLDDDEIIIELFNPTLSAIDLSKYSLFVDEIKYNKQIKLSGTISSFSTFTIATQYSDIKYDLISNYLVASKSDNIYLYKNNVIEQVSFNSTNAIRKDSIGLPSKTYNKEEWIFLENDLNNTLNNHKYSYDEYQFNSFEVQHEHIIYVDSNATIDYDKYIKIYFDNERISFDEDMILNKTNIVDNKYTLTIKVGVHTFNIEVNIISIPSITLANKSHTFDSTDIDLASLVIIDSNNTLKIVHDELVIGVNKITYIVESPNGLKNTLSIYINIKIA